MKKIEIELESTRETKDYYLYKVFSNKVPPAMFPVKKIYFRKDLFDKQPKNIILTVTPKGE